ncbi:histidine--tRNA ligase [Candidatus Woesearchaeota archaeon]|nr:histidine--tRNA ligase [Candidatus Woesearchaeota archaeon]
MKPETAKGVRDIPPEEKIIKNQVLSAIREIFELYGFAPLETPLIERYETLAAKGSAGEESDVLKEIFKFTDQGERKLGLRFDLTVPLARYMSMNPNLKLPFKRYELGPVFRDGPIKLGRYREFWQVDVDIIGTKSMLADAEIIALTDAVFRKLNLDIVIKINTRKLLNGLLEQADIKSKEEAIIAIDKLSKIGKEGVTTELSKRGYTKKQITSLFSLIQETSTLQQLKGKITNAEGQEGITELEEIFRYLQKMGITSAIFDVSLARGLAYYTGTVMEAFLKSGKITSSLAGGGRYDQLIQKLGGPQLPAVGISFGLEPIMDTLKLEKGLVGAKTPAKVYIIPLNTEEESLSLAQELRRAGIPADLSLAKKSLSKNLKYAHAQGIPYVIILGDNELKQKKVLLRDMNDGTEQLLTVKDTIEKLK